jgi:hypothetical protein
VAAGKALGADNSDLFQYTLPMSWRCGYVVRIQQLPFEKMPLRLSPAATHLLASQAAARAGRFLRG